MKGISGFFDKFKNVALKELKKREVIISTIASATGHTLDMKDISIKNEIILIQGSQALKSEIFLKKKKILERISSEGLSFVDIK